LNSPLAQIDLAVVFPQVILSITAILVLLAGLILPRRQHVLLAILSLAGVLLAMIVSLHHPMLSTSTFNQMATLDGLTIVFNLIFYISTAFIIVLSIPFLEREDVHPGEYYSLILFAVVGMILMAGTTDLMIIFLGLELMSISLYILASITRDNPKSNEAAMKYLLLGAFATGFLLYGIALIYGATGSTNLMEITRFMSQRRLFLSGWMLPVGLGLVMVGLGFKIGMVPFHSWIPDVYEGSPTIVTAFMSIGPKAAGFAGLVRIFIDGPFYFVNIPWPFLIAVFAGLTMTVGNVVAIAQGNIKRMLAYSSIAHAGYIMLGLVSANHVYTPAILFYFFGYMFMNMGAFAVVFAVQQSEGVGNTLKSYSGLGYKQPMLALAMTFFMLSLSGFPPTAGFMGKFYLFKGAIDSGHIPLVIIAVVNSVISVYYYLHVVVFMYMREPEDDTNIPAISPLVGMVILLCVLGVFYMGILPEHVLHITQLSLYF
jgi:NADH-quinone oxidoreductase subunit N